MNLDPVIFAAIVAGVISLLGTVGGYFITRRLNDSQSRRNDSSAVSEVAESSTKLLGPLNDRIDKLGEQIFKLTNDLLSANQRIAQLTTDLRVRDAELEGLRGGVVVLVAQLKEAGILPRYTPPPYKGGGL